MFFDPNNKLKNNKTLIFQLVIKSVVYIYTLFYIDTLSMHRKKIWKVVRKKKLKDFSDMFKTFSPYYFLVCREDFICIFIFIVLAGVILLNITVVQFLLTRGSL